MEGRDFTAGVTGPGPRLLTLTHLSTAQQHSLCPYQTSHSGCTGRYRGCTEVVPPVLELVTQRSVCEGAASIAPGSTMPDISTAHPVAPYPTSVLHIRSTIPDISTAHPVAPYPTSVLHIL
eukprot:2373028-Rhodomonas_salina.1